MTLKYHADVKASGVDWLGAVPASWAVTPLWALFERIKDVGHPEMPMLSVFREFGVVLIAAGREVKGDTTTLEDFSVIAALQAED